MPAAEVGDQIGVLMNAPTRPVSTFQNVTTCKAVVASCFDCANRDSRNSPSLAVALNYGMGSNSRWHSKPKCMSSVVNVAPGATATHTYGPCRWIDMKHT
jgi:hypothetical protein